jgi:hypothetical protein
MRNVHSSAVKSIAACLLAITTVACSLLPAGDRSINVDFWNPTLNAFVVRLGPDKQGPCRALPPETLGSAYQDFGVRPRVRVYSAGGELIADVVPRVDTVLVVMNSLGVEREVALEYRRPSEGGAVVYDLPDLPQLNGRALPDLLPATTDVCDEPPPSGTRRPAPF